MAARIAGDDMSYSKKILAFGMSLAGFISCADNNAFVRVLHNSPDAPNVDVLVNDSTALENVAYLESSNYLEVGEGSNNIKVNPTGTEDSVIDEDVSLTEGVYYTVIASDVVANIGALILTDDRTEPEAGNVRVRVVHGAPSAPAVDVYVTAASPDLSNETPVLENVSFEDFSDFLEIAEGTYEINVTLTGTTTVAIGPVSVTLNDGEIRTIVAVESDGGGAPFDLNVLADN